ncbi:hypothetical protein VM1G_11150 [Cytospora mali]|uniref:Uncharacterized protein n=1 Tax=Cytospora mali TaxID=578113 RepID=A0A194VKG7_CYTMA|nr:hypothetical protein VM1G_11150 [Valsa mali]
MSASEAIRPVLASARPIPPARPHRAFTAVWMLEEALSVLGLTVNDSTSKRRSEYQGLSDLPSNSTCRTPDGMVYHDSAGVRREIKNMTTEMYEKAMDIYGRGDLGVLNGTVVYDKDALGATDKA